MEGLTKIATESGLGQFIIFVGVLVFLVDKGFYWVGKAKSAIFRIWQPEKEGQSKELDALQIINLADSDKSKQSVRVMISRFRNDKNGVQKEYMREINEKI